MVFAIILIASVAVVDFDIDSTFWHNATDQGVIAEGEDQRHIQGTVNTDAGGETVANVTYRNQTDVIEQLPKSFSEFFAGVNQSQ